jgi:FixJ family two-component response regulator
LSVGAVGRRVLLVEDDESMRTAVERLLNAYRFECIAYASAEELLATGAGDGAACVVSDLMLPAMSGLKMLDEMRTRGGWPPLALVTAHDRPGLCEEAMQHGAAGYLAKPFHGAALVAAVESAIRGARPHG